MMRIMKEELVWSNDCQSYHVWLAAALDTWFGEYKTKYFNSALCYKPTSLYEKQQLRLNYHSPLVAA